MPYGSIVLRYRYTRTSPQSNRWVVTCQPNTDVRAPVPPGTTCVVWLPKEQRDVTFEVNVATLGLDDDATCWQGKLVADDVLHEHHPNATVSLDSSPVKRLWVKPQAIASLRRKGHLAPEIGV